jgi:hypothetical protein
MRLRFVPVAGQQPQRTSLRWFQRNRLPTDWVAPQTPLLGRHP